MILIHVWMEAEYGSHFRTFRRSDLIDDDIFRVTGHLCGEFTGPRWIPRTKASDAERHCFFDLRLNKRLSKQSWGWRFETPSRPFWRHCNYHLSCFMHHSWLWNRRRIIQRRFRDTNGIFELLVFATNSFVICCLYHCRYHKHTIKYTFHGHSQRIPICQNVNGQ